MTPNSTTTRVSSNPIKNIENRTRAPIIAPQCLLVQVAISPTFLSLRGGALYRDFDVLEWYALIPQHPLNILPGARRELRVVARWRDLHLARDQVGPVIGGERGGWGLGPDLPRGAFGQGLHGARGDDGLVARRVVHDCAPRHPPPEGELPQEQEQGDERQEHAGNCDHDPRPRREGRGGEVTQGRDPAPVPGVLVYHLGPDDPERHEQQEHGDHQQQQGYYQQHDSVESVHCTLVFVCLGSASTSFTLSLLTGNPLLERCSCTVLRRPSLIVPTSSPRRTVPSMSTWAPGLRWAFALTEDPSTPGTSSATAETSSSTTRRVVYVPLPMRTRLGDGGLSSAMSNSRPSNTRRNRMIRVVTERPPRSTSLAKPCRPLEKPENGNELRL